MSRSRLIGLLLALFTLAVYLPVAHLGFIVYDDGDYVTKNPMVREGLSAAGIKWAFTTFHSANWHPVTWLSHMVDCQLFGLNPAGPHCINALLHAANTVLVFALWLRLLRGRNAQYAQAPENEDGAIWPAAFIAALFAAHPLHVESVAWVSERKDVLSTFFGLLSLLCYARFALPGSPLKRKSSTKDSAIAARTAPPRRDRAGEGIDGATGDTAGLSGQAGCAAWVPRSKHALYAFALVFFALGLMAKPMLVTWPFVML
ncbi:MAG: hypothetical protein ACREFR_10760, partial [Limisphaerales bacterium]